MKRLSDIKRFLQVSAVVRCTFGPKAGSLREVVAVQTNGIYFKTESAKNGKSWLNFPKASLLEVNETGFKIYYPGSRDLTPEERACMDNEPRDPEQEKIDMLSDSSRMYYRRMGYYKSSPFPYLFQHENGKSFNHQSGKVTDPTVKGDLVLVYEFVK